MKFKRFPNGLRCDLGWHGYLMQLCQMVDDLVPYVATDPPPPQLDPFGLPYVKFHLDRLWPELEIVTNQGARYVKTLEEIEQWRDRYDGVKTT